MISKAYLSTVCPEKVAGLDISMNDLLVVN
jgi:hypothetical protein